MSFPESRIRVFRYGQPADMRKSYDGLHALARQGFDTDPLAGHLFVFANRRATRIKVLYFDRSPRAPTSASSARKSSMALPTAFTLGPAPRTTGVPRWRYSRRLWPASTSYLLQFIEPSVALRS